MEKDLKDLTEEEFELIKKEVEVETMIREEPLTVLLEWRNKDPERKLYYIYHNTTLGNTIKWVCVLTLKLNNKEEKFFVLKQGKKKYSDSIKKECLKNTALECIRFSTLLGDLSDDLSDILASKRTPERILKRKRIQNSFTKNKKIKTLNDDEDDVYEEGYTGRKLTQEEKTILDKELKDYFKKGKMEEKMKILEDSSKDHSEEEEVDQEEKIEILEEFFEKMIICT